MRERLWASVSLPYLLLLPFAVLCVTSQTLGSDGLEKTLSKCCMSGLQASWNNRTCSNYPSPVPGVLNEHQAPCLSVIDACCRKSYRDRQCVQGQLAARTGKDCATSAVGHSTHVHQDCCEGCKLGLVAGAMGLNCEFNALKQALGLQWDTSFIKCCIQAGGRKSSPPSWTTTSEYDDGGVQSSTYRPILRSTTISNEIQTRDVCVQFAGQLCAHNCVTEGSSYRCTCREGFRLLPDAKSCQRDPYGSSPSFISSTSPSQSRPPPPTPTRVPENQCPRGFVYNPSTQVCDDVDECLTGEGTRACLQSYKTCKNTRGSFVCQEAPTLEPDTNVQCPPGYKVDSASGECIDIDECKLGYDICARDVQYCINTPGGFDCQNKKEFNRYNCPAGYKFNNYTLSCEDVDECTEQLDSCESTSEVCRNTAGAYECDATCESGYRYDIRARSCQDVDECTEGTHDCKIDRESCVNVPGRYQCHQLTQDSNCPPGYEPKPDFNFLCQDRDECTTGLHTCAPTEVCINEVGGYRCDGASDTTDDDYDDNTDGPETKAGSGNGNEQQTTNDIRKSSSNCPVGYRRASGDGLSCVDINECTEANPCDSSQVCQNTPGSFYCTCRTGYYRDPITQACVDINECQTGQHTCLSSQRCDNSPGSYSCIRITGCGTGYTLNSQTGQCEDDDECYFGNNDCARLGPEYQCKNTPGSFRCERVQRQCPTGLSLAPNGDCRPICDPGYQYNSRGECVDIDECRGSEGQRMCNPQQQCINTDGSYTCMSRIICPAGFEPDDNGTRCVDRDECLDGTHTCKGNQQCLNRGGGYICQCPSGHTLTAAGDCEDTDECLLYSGQVCASNADCHNTIGSFRCICKDGFVHGDDNRTCTDVDECSTIQGLCEQTCINTWGSHKCSCGTGFNLGEDGRSCRDIDECSEERDGFRLCIGNCVNTHGSYRCDCPEGYRLGSDSRSCIDIDECQTSQVCRSDEHCLNTRGGFRCNRIDCPAGYIRDGDQTDRCKKSSPCQQRDQLCIRDPLTISKNFISFTSNLRIPSVGYIDLFTMRGPTWAGAVMHFNLKVKSSRAPSDVEVADRNYFLLRRPTNYQAVVALAKPVAGPQDIELELKMEVFHRGAFAGSAVAEILIVVTRYEF